MKVNSRRNGKSTGFANFKEYAKLIDKGLTEEQALAEMAEYLHPTQFAILAENLYEYKQDWEKKEEKAQ